MTESILYEILEQRRVALLDAHANTINISIDANVSAQEWVATKKLLNHGRFNSKNPKGLAIVRDSAGSPATSTEGASQIIQDHFCEVECGTQMPLQQIVDNYNDTPPP